MWYKPKGEYYNTCGFNYHMCQYNNPPQVTSHRFTHHFAYKLRLVSIVFGYWKLSIESISQASNSLHSSLTLTHLSFFSSSYASLSFIFILLFNLFQFFYNTLSARLYVSRKDPLIGDLLTSQHSGSIYSFV